MLKNMRIGFRLGLIIGSTLILMLVVGIVGIINMGTLADLTNKLYRHPYTVSTSVISIDRFIVSMHRGMKDVALAKDEEGINKASSIVDQYEAEVFELFKIVDERFLGDKKMVNDALQAFKDWKIIRDEVIKLALEGRREEAGIITRAKGAEHVAKLNRYIQALEDFASNKAATFRQNANNVYENVQFFMYTLLAIALVIGIVLSVIIGASLKGPLQKLATTIIEVETTGDFSKTTDLKSKDEIGRTAMAFDSLMNTMQSAFGDINRVMDSMLNADLTERISNDYGGNLKGENINRALEMVGSAIFQVTSSADEVNNGAVQLQASAQALASGTTEQAASLEEVTSSVNEVESQAKKNSEYAGQAQQLSRQSIETVEKGNSQMNTMLQSMDSISETSNKVAKVIKVIDEIAFQTNLLALNAAVEAARAGKYGKGFAVVAEEVRNLAGRSAEAAKDTTELIDTSLKEVEAGVSNTRLTADVLKEINENVTKVNDLVAEISA
ncbi:MAG: methyl-accepting chemotaxis protein, partial [Proteobacteria bacterium]|nr:methyl-accepting chemotaxis protein [Pseudomonadota bacterium]